MVVHWKELGNKAKGCASVRLIESFPAQTVDEMVADEMEVAGAHRFRNGTRKTGPRGFYYRGVFPGEKVVKCSLVEELKLRAREMLRRKPVSETVRRVTKKKLARVSRLRREVKKYERHAAS